jgi:hypothetical protein
MDIYTDICFIAIAHKESLTSLAAVSAISIVIIALPKFYAYALILMMICTCAREEDKRRKYALRAYTFNEFRVHALNIEYVEYERQKVNLSMGIMKFFFEDLP